MKKEIRLQNLLFPSAQNCTEESLFFRRIGDIELFINSTIAYAVLMLFIYFVRIGIINLEYIAKLSEFLSLKEYILMYVILVVISRLISIKFSRQLFKNTVMNTYKEEV